MKLNLKWYTGGDNYYAPLYDGDGYIPTFYIKKFKNNFTFIDIRMIHSAIKEQFLEVCEGENGYYGGGKEKNKCNKIINLNENHRKSISSLLEN